MGLLGAHSLAGGFFACFVCFIGTYEDSECCLSSAKRQSALSKTDTFGNGTVSVLMRDAVQKDRGSLGTRTIIEMTFRGRTSHSVFHSKGNSPFATEFHSSIMLTENELCSALKIASHVYRLARKPRASGWVVRFCHVDTVGTSLDLELPRTQTLSLDEIFASHFSLSHSPLRFVNSHSRVTRVSPSPLCEKRST